MSKNTLAALVIAVVAAAAALTGWSLGVFDGEPRPAAYDVTQKSTDLARDLKLMWETERQPVSSDSGVTPETRVATDRAINAASRVFNTIKLAGRTRAEVVALVGEQNSVADVDTPLAESKPDRVMVYRFDRGAYGWQFTLEFGPDGKVTEVQRKWLQ